ncbi:Uric acid-xanthine permease [Ceratocystis lukuohia]|uniref:Uric acid-xanthine permease n=1 Tax=Ceratocystis lukuohia TaxID=2019550 RepID=A0ABR4MQH8_9PEZI
MDEDQGPSNIAHPEDAERNWSVGSCISGFKRMFFTRDGLIGDYNYGHLFRPNLPFMKKSDHVAPFFGLNDRMPVVLALLLGLQHSLAMLAGVITPPIIMSGATGVNLSTDEQQYLVSTALIVSGTLSLIQITRFRIMNTPYYLGTGLLSVVGISFAIIPVASGAFSQMYADGYCELDSDGNRLPCPKAYGAVLGTAALCALIEVCMAFVPPRMLLKVFPPIVTGPTVTLIGVSLIETGFSNWAGGSGACMDRPETGFYSLCPNTAAPHPLPWGSAEFLGLGFIYIICACEAIGDITATCDVSRLEVTGPTYETRIQGGVLADGINGALAALMTITPVTTFAQNNGVIALTRCANRTAGYFCCFFLIVMGIFAKFAAALVAIPSAVLGGMTTFLFASVAVSGMAIVARSVPFTRRNRFILTAGFALGYGATLKSDYFSYFFTYDGSNKSLKGFLNAIDIIMESGFVVAAFVCTFLNLALPEENEPTLAEEVTRSAAPISPAPESSSSATAVGLSGKTAALESSGRATSQEKF